MISKRTALTRFERIERDKTRIGVLAIHLIAIIAEIVWRVLRMQRDRTS